MVNFIKFLGTWHEIARTPNRFEKDCRPGSSVASYTLIDNRLIRIVNVCTDSVRDTQRTSVAVGCIVSSNALKVLFGPSSIVETLQKISPWPLGSDYIIVYADPEYRHAIVSGGPNSGLVWILSRNSSMENSVYERLVAIAADKCLPTNKLQRF